MTESEKMKLGVWQFAWRMSNEKICTLCGQMAGASCGH